MGIHNSIYLNAALVRLANYKKNQLGFEQSDDVHFSILQKEQHLETNENLSFL